MILEPKICLRFHFFSFYLSWNYETKYHNLSFSMFFFNVVLSQIFHSPLSLSSRGSLVPLHFLPLKWYHLHICVVDMAILISAWNFTWWTLACKLNKQGDNILPRHDLFPNLNQLVIPCPVLTGASWPVYRFLRRQIRCSGNLISWRIFHSLLWSIQSKASAYFCLYTCSYSHFIWNLTLFPLNCFCIFVKIWIYLYININT